MKDLDGSLTGRLQLPGPKPEAGDMQGVGLPAFCRKPGWVRSQRRLGEKRINSSWRVDVAAAAAVVGGLQYQCSGGRNRQSSVSSRPPWSTIANPGIHSETLPRKNKAKQNKILTPSFSPFVCKQERQSCCSQAWGGTLGLKALGGRKWRR